MPSLSTFAVFTVAAVALILIPGPNHIYITARGVAEGSRAAMTSALGVEIATLVHAMAAAVGLSALIASSATAFRVVAYVGAAYLIYLGVRTLVRPEPDVVTQDAPRSGGLRRVFAAGFVVNLTNPKVGLFFLAFLPQFVHPSAGSAATQFLLLGAWTAVLGLAVDLLYAVGSGRIAGWAQGRPAVRRRQRWITGVIYIGLGLTTAVAAPTRVRT
jgi:threonine/homoserine/homoserine lactone efflux protein